MTDRVPPYTPTWEERHAFHAYPLPGCPLCEHDLDASSNRVPDRVRLVADFLHEQYGTPDDLSSNLPVARELLRRLDAIPNSEAKPPYQGESAYYRHLEQERKDAESGRATRNRAARVWVGIETYNWGEEIDHVRVFTGKDKAEQWRDEKPMVRGIEEAEVE